MAKVFGPCLSVGAHGSVKKTITYQRRPSGVAAIEPPRPGKKRIKNPTASQLSHRNQIASLVSQWQALSQIEKDDWASRAFNSGLNLSGYHYFMRENFSSVVTYTYVLGPYSSPNPSVVVFALNGGKLA